MSFPGSRQGITTSADVTVPHQESPYHEHGIYLKCEIEARDFCPVHFSTLCNCPLNNVRRTENPWDQGVKALLQLMNANIFGSAAGTQTITDIGNTGRAVTINQATTAMTLVAGTSGTAPAFTDYKIGAPANPQSTASYNTTTITVNAISNGPPGTETITGTITNTSGGNLTYAEVGIQVTNSTWIFLVAHDTVNSGTGFVVSQNGTLALTYTATIT